MTLSSEGTPLDAASVRHESVSSPGGSSGVEYIACDVHQHALHEEVVWPARCVEHKDFLYSDSRIGRFTEEVVRWVGPRHGRERSRAKSISALGGNVTNRDRSVHVLSSSPFVIESYGGWDVGMQPFHRTFDFRNMMRSMGQEIDGVQMTSLMAQHRLAVFLPSSLDPSMILFDPTNNPNQDDDGGSMDPYFPFANPRRHRNADRGWSKVRLPPSMFPNSSDDSTDAPPNEDGWTTTFLETFGGGSASTATKGAFEHLVMVDSDASENGSIVLADLRHGRDLVMFDWDDKKINHVRLPSHVGGLQNVLVASSSNWLIRANDASDYWLMWGPGRRSCVLRPCTTSRDGALSTMSVLSVEGGCQNVRYLSDSSVMYGETSDLPKTRKRAEDDMNATMTMFQAPWPKDCAFVAASAATMTVVEETEETEQENSHISVCAAVRHEMSSSSSSTTLYVADTSRATYREIPVLAHCERNDSSEASNTRAIDVARWSTSSTHGYDTALLSLDGSIHIFETHAASLRRSLKTWETLFGRQGGEEEQQERSDRGAEEERGSIPRTSASMPKHGKEDDKPHVGGNTWAGGTGGSDTAGLGGRGGPYRLDKGFPVHQVSEADKAAVSEEAREAARKMAQDAFRKRMSEIDMSEEESEIYRSVRDNVSRQVEQLRAILRNADLQSKERGWLRHQTSGELDDTKLVDGVAGERAVFRRRSDNSTDAIGQPPPAPRRLRFLVDISGSMYRFNGQDGRLNRVLETTLMVMESFTTEFKEKFEYQIVGHSGDGPDHDLVHFDAPPQNEKERLRVIEKMVARSQFCMSGDHTVEALELAVDEACDEMKGDDNSIVVLISDANLRRYAIPPAELANQMTRASRANVSAYAIFIASIGDEAERLRRELPHGNGFVCLDTADVPVLMQKIFASEFGGASSTAA